MTEIAGTDSLPTPPVDLSNTAWNIVKVLVCLVLFCAAGIKTVRVAEIVASEGLLSSQPLLLTVIAFEAAVAVYILICPAWWSWLSVMVTFLLFAVAAFYSVVTQTDCHCFGDSFGPKLTLPLDLAILLVSYCFRPSTKSRSQPPINWTILLPLAAASSFVVFAEYHHERQVADNVQDVDILLADMWIGKEWPLTQSIHPKLQELDNGKWLVLVMRSNCEHCRELIEREFSDPQRHRPGERTAVFIAGDQIWPFHFDHISMHADQSETIRWNDDEPFVASPAIFCVSDGSVTSAADGSDADNFLAEILSDTLP